MAARINKSLVIVSLLPQNYKLFSSAGMLFSKNYKMSLNISQGKSEKNNDFPYIGIQLQRISRACGIVLCIL